MVPLVISFVPIGNANGTIGSPNLNLNLNSLLVKRQVDNPSPGAVTGGN